MGARVAADNWRQMVRQDQLVRIWDGLESKLEQLKVGLRVESEACWTTLNGLHPSRYRNAKSSFRGWVQSMRVESAARAAQPVERAGPQEGQLLPGVVAHYQYFLPSN